ncbi:MAG: 1,4-dihydroxy-2-naphthoate octaprenyltransferase [Waddliaceae bacterium]
MRQSHYLPHWMPWFMAARPKTLTAAFVPIVAGTMLAYAEIGQINKIIFFSALVTALFIQMGTNLINDALDFKKGADTEKRLGPQRVTQMGYLKMQEVFAWGVSCLAIAMIFGIPLMIHAGWPLAAVLLLSACCGYFYTGGPLPLAYCGLGDLFVLIFFGVIATVFAYFLQTGYFSLFAFLAGGQIGLLAMVMIGINNLRDVVEDTQANKRTLPVRFGKRLAKDLLAATVLLPFFLNLFWVQQGFYAAACLPWAALPLAVYLIKEVRNAEPGIRYNHFLAVSACLHASFGILLSAGLYLK